MIFQDEIKTNRVSLIQLIPAIFVTLFVGGIFIYALFFRAPPQLVSAPTVTFHKLNFESSTISYLEFSIPLTPITPAPPELVLALLPSGHSQEDATEWAAVVPSLLDPRLGINKAFSLPSDPSSHAADNTHASPLLTAAFLHHIADPSLSHPHLIVFAAHDSAASLLAVHPSSKRAIAAVVLLFPAFSSLSEISPSLGDLPLLVLCSSKDPMVHRITEFVEDWEGPSQLSLINAIAPRSLESVSSQLAQDFHRFFEQYLHSTTLKK